MSGQPFGGGRKFADTPRATLQRRPGNLLREEAEYTPHKIAGAWSNTATTTETTSHPALTRHIQKSPDKTRWEAIDFSKALLVNCVVRIEAIAREYLRRKDRPQSGTPNIPPAASSSEAETTSCNATYGAQVFV